MRPIAATFACLAVGAAAQAPADCRDDNGVDRCRPERQAQARALFGVPAIEGAARAGEEVRRVFYVDGYGRDLLVIAAGRARDGGPRLTVHFPAVEGTRAEPLVAAMPPALWRDVLARAAALPWAPPAARADTKAEVRLCLHAWVYTLEAAGPGVRRVTEDACADGPHEAFATFLADAAVPLFPHCAALERAKHRNAATLLHACRNLSGERVAAARVMNMADAFRGVGGRGDAARLAPVFTPGALVEWAGTRTGPGGPAAFWAERMGPGDGSVAHLHAKAIEGLSADRVRLTGLIVRSADTPRGAKTGSETAAVEQLWARGPDGTFRVAEATVGPWRVR